MDISYLIWWYQWGHLLKNGDFPIVRYPTTGRVSASRATSLLRCKRTSLKSTWTRPGEGVQCHQFRMDVLKFSSFGHKLNDILMYYVIHIYIYILHVYIYICMYVCMNVYIYIWHVYIYIYIYIYTYRWHK